MHKLLRTLTHPPYRPALLFALAALLFMVPAVAFGAELLQTPPDPAGTEVHQVILFFIGALIGVIGSPLTGFITEKLGVSSVASLLVTYAVSAVVAVVELIILGWFAPEMLTVENLPVLFGAVFAGATGYFEIFTKRKAEAEG